MNAITQDPLSVANGVRTISLRLVGTEEAKEELESLGEDVSDFEVTTKSKMAETIKDLTSVGGKEGISILTETGNYRSTYEILLDIAKIWDEIKEEDLQTGNNRQNALLESMAGKLRSNILASILANPTLLEDVYTQAQNATGSAQAELDKWMESTEAKLQQFSNAWQEVWATTLDSDIVNFFIDLGTGAGELTTKIGGLIPVVTGLGAAVLSLGKNVGTGKCTPSFGICRHI